MTHPNKKEILEQINDLFLQTENEILKYNWIGAIELLKKVEKIILNEKLSVKEIECELYYKLGELYQVNANFEKKEDDVLKNFQLSILNFQKAYDIYEKLENEEKINELSGSINFITYLLGSNEGNEESLLKNAKDYFNRAKQINLKKSNFPDFLKMALLESRALNLLLGEKIIRIDEKTDSIALASEYENLMADIWEKIKKGQNFPEICHYHFFTSTMEFCQWALSYLPAENSINKQHIMNNYDRIKEFIDIFEKKSNAPSLFVAYTFIAWFNTILASYFVDSQFEQKKHLKIAEKWLKKADQLLTKNNTNKALVLFYYTRFAVSILLISLGFFAKDFKHVMGDLDECTNLLYVYFPRILLAHSVFYAASTFAVGALSLSIPDVNTRINLANIALDLLESAIPKISIITNPDYKIYDLFRKGVLCVINALLGDLIKDRKESSTHLQIALNLFNEISKFSNPKIENTFLHFNYLFGVARTGIIFAKISANESEKVSYYLKAIDLLLKSKKISISLFSIENLFLIGDLYYEVGELTNDDKIFKNSYSSYIEAIEYCKDKGYSNLVGSGYVKLAQIEDRLGNYLSAAENYKKAINSFNKAIFTLTYSRASKKIEKLKNYIEAWELIESAKSFHLQEDHNKAQLNYEHASQILKDIREYNFESPFYSAWALLEKAESLSKINKHQEAAATYIVSKGNFEDAVETFNSYISKRKSSKETERISKLIQVAKIRITYCSARYHIETARVESKNGNHLIASELYNKAGTLFYKICQSFRLKREKDELTAIYYLCKAWENMERADQDTTLYAIASGLFEKASNIFPESRMKKLSTGNSLYCSALHYGALFDESTELEKKINYYKRIKMNLREAAKNYKVGGFDQDAQWALGTSTFFDGIWHLIQADNEIDFTKKNQYLNIATNYMNNSLTIFKEAEYEQKQEEIRNYLEMISDEKSILTSALNVIEKPEISASSIGISAPASPAEISSSVNIEEMQETDLKTESELNWRKRIHYLCIFLKNGISIYDYTFKSKSEIPRQLIAKEDLEPHLVAGGLSGISALIKELTHSNTKIKIVEQEEMTILLEDGKYLTAALITEENLITLRNKLMQLILDVEDFFQEELEDFTGDLDTFKKIGKFVQKIFEI